jgi:hypothetical protein
MAGKNPKQIRITKIQNSETKKGGDLIDGCGL